MQVIFSAFLLENKRFSECIGLDAGPEGLCSLCLDQCTKTNDTAEEYFRETSRESETDVSTSARDFYSDRLSRA